MGKSRRVALNNIFKAVIGSENVYFQPPPNLTMKYPCIVYVRDNASTKHADNLPYSYMQRYQVTYIDYDPDSDVIDKLAALPMCVYNRGFQTTGLNHDVFVIYH